MPNPKTFILENSYPFLKTVNQVGRSIGLASPGRLRVLIYHDIGEYDHDRFAVQLKWLSRSWNFVTPEQFGRMVSGEEKINGRNLLVTFDDGLISNRIVAEKVLNPLGIKALFFVVSDLIEMSDGDAREFMIRNISKNTVEDAHVPLSWKNMRWNDLEALLQQGHTIGGHTKTHARLSEIHDKAQLRTEICESADIVAAKLGVSIDHFAFTFGDVNSISKVALDIAKERFRHIYSGVRGNNHPNTNIIFRDAAATQDAQLNYFIYSNHLLGSFLEGSTDIYYRSKREKLKAWSGVN